MIFVSLIIGIALGGAVGWFFAINSNTFRRREEADSLEFQIWATERKVELARLRAEENAILEGSASGGTD